MKKIIYLLMLGFVCCLPACEDVEVGYLETENAGYSIDTLSLYNIEERLVEYKAYLVKFNELAEPINEKIDELQEEWYEKDDILYWDYDEPMYELGEQIENASGAEKDRLQAEYDKLNAEREVLRQEMQGIQNEQRKLRNDVKQIAIDMGFDSAAQITDGVSKLENTLKYKIPWVTSGLEGVKGTEPMSYSIVEVRNEKPENAELFRKSLSIMGGGRMHVALDVEAPAGEYIVSIAIDNEGQHAVLEDAFTFIVEE